MSDCVRQDVRDLLPELMHGRLDAETHVAVTRHVASCPACTAELALLRSLRSALEPAPAAVPPVDADRIAAAIVEARHVVRQPAEPAAAGHIAPAAAHPPPPRAARRRAAWRAAAAIAVVAGGITTWSLLEHEPAVRYTPIATPATSPIAIGAGLVMDGGVSDLPDSDVEALLESLDSVRAVPDADPAPVTYHIGAGVL